LIYRRVQDLDGLGRLSFVGLGLGSKGISLEGIDELKQADMVYLEYYTTPHEPSLLKVLEEASGKTIIVVDRAFVEDGNKILDEAGMKKIALAVPGDPMIATTHEELRVRATKRGIETKLVHATTISTAVASASGLHYYKFSRTVTVTREAVNRLTQVYQVLHENLLEGAHTLILLEYDSESGTGVQPPEALAGLLRAEDNFKRGVVSGTTFVLVASRIGRPGAGLSAGRVDELIGRDFGEPPHSIVIPGALHFTEVEAISATCRIEESRVIGNSEGVLRPAQTLVPKYVAKTQKALESVRGKVGPQYASVIENAELYMRDAEKFLANGEDELAMLSIGYAEGLLDSLTFAGVAKIDW